MPFSIRQAACPDSVPLWKLLHNQFLPCHYFFSYDLITMAKIRKIEIITKCFCSYLDFFSVVRLYFNFDELSFCICACNLRKGASHHLWMVGLVNPVSLAHLALLLQPEEYIKNKQEKEGFSPLSLACFFFEITFPLPFPHPHHTARSCSGSGSRCRWGNRRRWASRQRRQVRWRRWCQWAVRWRRRRREARPCSQPQMPGASGGGSSSQRCFFWGVSSFLCVL